jgi:hypothetical protein
MRISVNSLHKIPVILVILVLHLYMFLGKLRVESFCALLNDFKEVEIVPVQSYLMSLHFCEVKQVINQIQKHGGAELRILEKDLNLRPLHFVNGHTLFVILLDYVLYVLNDKSLRIRRYLIARHFHLSLVHIGGAFDFHGVQPFDEIDQVRGDPHIFPPLLRALIHQRGDGVLLSAVEWNEILDALIALIAFSRGI